VKDWTDFQIDIPRNANGPEVYTTCPQCSLARKKKHAKCLSANLVKLVWCCAHCGWTGTLKGGEEKRSRVDRFRPAVYTRPVFTPATSHSDALLAFFATRKIGYPTIQKYKLSVSVEWMPQLEERVECLQFPYYRGDECINVKSRSLLGKHFQQVADAEKILYGLNDVTDSWVVITEGELDKLSFAHAGIPQCVSVPDGAPQANAKPSEKKFEYLANCEATLEPLTKIIIATDNDAPGHALEEELSRRLGRERCWRVHWPEGVKDANELLVRDGEDALHALIAEATPWPIEGIIRIADVAEDVMRYYYEGRQHGLSTGWAPLDTFYTVRQGEVTVVTGTPGHGKSEFLDARAVHLCDLHGWIFAVCSPENRPVRVHMRKLIEKVVGLPFLPGPTERMSPKHVAEALEWLHERVYFIDPDAAMTVPALLTKARAMVLRHGITGLIVDPWNEFDHTRTPGMTETEYISQCLSLFRNFSRTHHVHVWIVAHPTKMRKGEDGRYPVPTPWDISGSAHWHNKADNCLAVWRDVTSEDHYSEVHVQKIRSKEIGRVGAVGMLWTPASGRYDVTALRET
jgi:twinkle protein